MIGEVIGNYRITGKLGEGGMGQVYRAEHTLIGRGAALKVLLPQYSSNRNIVTRFFNEARAASAIKHPGIVEILDFGYHGEGSAYILMELLEGETLQARVGRMRLMPVELALRLTRQVAGALAAAHEQGIVHRDLKPENIFIVADPEVAGGERIKLLDFGIAKLADESEPGLKTQTGMIMGTPRYMAPEQCKGAGRVDHRADLYSLGCILFQMLCGRPPFAAKGGGEVLAQQIYAQPPVASSLVAGLPAELDALLAELLAKEPEHRPQTARTLMDRLEALLQADGAAYAPTGPGLQPARPETAQPPPTGPGLQPARPAIARPPTTLSAGVGAVDERPARSRRGLIVRAAIAAVGVAVGVVYVLLGDSAEPARTAAGDVEPAQIELEPVEAAPLEVPEPAEPAAEPAELEPAAEAPAWVEVTIESEPRAEVIHDGERLGDTPFTARVLADSEHEYVLRRRGYEDARVRIPADADDSGTARVALDARPRSRSRPTPDRAAAPAQGERPAATGGTSGRRKPGPRSKKDDDLRQGGSLPF